MLHIFAGQCISGTGEKYFIENGPNDLNKINSVGIQNIFYNDALEWVTQSCKYICA